MKRAILSVLFVIAAAAVTGQSVAPLKVETFYLSNGLKVIVAEEHSQPKIHGAVIVHAGSKNEDTNATGVAHYFEHIMFKGTDRIGTTNWAKESLYLDSISDAYDRLQSTKVDSLRRKIQLEINRLNIEASKYAIANETDAILRQMGCTGLNAGTSYDQTVYYNTLPSNQLENWMEVYAERFRNPVYRLFQGELEAVYEERNLYQNQMMYTFIRNLFTESFGDHPYSRDIIGLDEHLKNPQPSAMRKFYERYYVASNMTLVLVGDLNPAEVRTMAEKYFSIWSKGEPAVQNQYNLPTFSTRVVKEVKQTPIKVGLMVFPGVKNNDPDELALNVLSSILSGGNGSLNALATQGKLMEASLMPLTLRDAGTNVILYVPKLLGQKHEKAEELIWAAIDSVKAGHFSDKLLESIKMSDIKDRKHQLESYTSIASLLMSLESSGSSYEAWEADFQKLQNLTKADIMAVAKKYFDRDHCTIVRSSMGFPNKEAAIKPNWDHLEAQNKGAQTEFAKEIAARKPQPILPQVINFSEAVKTVDVTKDCKLYASKNPKNDLFDLTISYHYGNYDNHNISQATDYFNMLGADTMTLEQYNIEMGCLGGSFTLGSDDDYSYISISGPEGNMNQIIALAMKKLRNPRHDPQQIKNLVEALAASKKAAKNDADTWASALYEYVMFGDKSNYINHATIKEVKKMKEEDMMKLISNIFLRDGYVTFVGNTDPHYVASLLRENNMVCNDVTVTPQRTRQFRRFDTNAVFYCTNKSFLQSEIDMVIPSINMAKADKPVCATFNEYFGGGMNSVVFQEIREFRSLGYSTYGYFRYNEQNLYPGYLFGYLGTQCDKTNDGIAALSDLMVNFPDREEKFVLSRDYLISVRNSNYYTFRSIPGNVRYWREIMKVDHDPRVEMTRQIEQLKYSDLRAFHEKYIANRPLVIVISGNAKKFDMKDLSRYGKVTKVKYKDMIKF